MLIEKEIIAPGTYWYIDEKTSLPRKLEVTPELTHYWRDQGNAMLSAGLTVPVPYEHDFNAHPMTPKDKLLNNAGWTAEYRLKGDKLYGILDIQDEEVAKKLPRTIRWTSPWINSFTDGSGKQWNNVISHIALTTRPRISKQDPFPSIAAAMSLATPIKVDVATPTDSGFCLSRAGRIVVRKKDKKVRPQYPVAFSMFSGGVKFGNDDDDMEALDDEGDEWNDEDEGDESGVEDEVEEEDVSPLGDPRGDIRMEEILCDLLNALGVYMPENVSESEFKRALYEASMAKIRELTGKELDESEEEDMAQNNQAAQNTAPAARPNPLIQQEQQPMYMSLEEINSIADPTMRTIALSMYQQNARLSAQLEAQNKRTEALHQSELRKATAARATRVQLLSKLSPHVKPDLESMLASPDMALSIGDNGVVVDPMSNVLAMLEKSLSDIPRLLTTNHSALSVQPHPTDADLLDDEESARIADNLARMMGCAPEKKTA